MPVIDSLPNALNSTTSATPYACKDKVFSKRYALKVRMYEDDGTYTMVNRFIQHTMSKDCRYDRSLSDVRCSGCGHRGSGEEYDSAVRDGARTVLVTNQISLPNKIKGTI